MIEIINYCFYTAISLVFILGGISLLKNYTSYKVNLLSINHLFDEIISSNGQNITELSSGAYKLAKRHCVTERKKNRCVVVLRDELVLINSALENVIPTIPDHGLKSVPAILTTLGILGTFIGISLGLAGLGEMSDSSQLLTQANELMLGMKTAFWTSAAGMLTSGIFMVSLSITQKKLQNKHSNTVSLLSQKVDELTPTDLLNEIATNIIKDKNEQQRFGELTDVLKEQSEQPVLTAHTFKEIIEVSLSNPLQQKLMDLKETLQDSVKKDLFDSAKLAADISTSINNSIAVELPKVITEPITHEIQKVHQDGISKIVNLLVDIKGNFESHPSITIDEIQTIIENKLTQPVVEAISTIVMKMPHFSGVSAAECEHIIVENLSKPLVTKLTESNLNIENILTELATIHNEMTPLTVADITEVMNTEVTKPIASNLHDINDGIKELVKGREEEFVHLVTTMQKDIVMPMTHELSETNRVVGDFAKVSNELNLSVINTVEKMSEATQSINNFEQKTLQKLNEFAGSLNITLNEFASNCTASLQSITGKMNGIVELGSLSIEQQTNAFTVLINDSKEMFSSQSQALESIGLTSATLLTTAKEQLEIGLGDIDSKVLNMSVVVQQELERFRIDYQKSLNDFFEMQTLALEESLGKQSQGLSDTVQKFKGVFEEEYNKRHSFLDSLNHQYENLIKSAETIEHLAETVGLNKVGQFDELAQVTHSIGRQVSAMNISFEKASKDFEMVATQIRPEMDDYFKRANEGIEKYFTSFDNVSSKIHSQLFEAAEYLITARKEQLSEDKKISEAEKVSV